MYYKFTVNILYIYWFTCTLWTIDVVDKVTQSMKTVQ